MQIQSKEWGNVSESVSFVMEQQLQADTAMLDVGCYTGTLIYRLAECGFPNVYGIDVDLRAVDRGKRLYPELESRIRDIPEWCCPFRKNHLMWSPCLMS